MDSEQLQQMRKEIVELRAENAALHAQMEGNIPQATRWLQTKVWRQRRALDILNRKVLSQRFRLRTIALMGRDLTEEEYKQAKAQLNNELVAERIDDYEPISA